MASGKALWCSTRSTPRPLKLSTGLTSTGRSISAWRFAGSVGTAFLSMSLFGLALSAPLFVLVTVPRTEALLQRVAARGQWLRLCVGWLLVAAGVWGVWFGLFVNPLEWR